MNAKLNYLLIMACAFGLIPRVYSQGYIVPNGVTYAGGGTFLGAEIHVLQNPTNGDYTGFNLAPRTMTQPTAFTNTFAFMPFLDEGVRTFLVSSNDPISLQPILDQKYTELTYPKTYVFNNGSPFYLGLYTGYAPVNGVYRDPLYGWVELVNNQGVIEMLDGALAYRADGIYAGTENIIQVPEPSLSALLLLGGVLIGLRIRCPRR